MVATTSLVLLELVGVAVELVLIVVIIGAFVILYKATGRQHKDMQRQHDDSVELLTFIETQIRTTRHAIRNLTDALNLRAQAVDVDGDIDEEAAQR